MTERIITDIEYEAGRVARNPERLKNIGSLEELITDSVQHQKEYCGVDYDSRVEFLETNGYQVTRENLVADLSSTLPPAIEAPELLQQLLNDNAEELSGAPVMMTQEEQAQAAAEAEPTQTEEPAA